jgi:hypothetical protein
MANTGVFSSTQMLSRFFVASRLLYFLCCLIALCSLASSAAPGTYQCTDLDG